MSNISTINDLQLKIAAIYKNANKEKDFEYMYGFLIRKTSYLSRGFLRNGDAKKYYIQSLSWLVAICDKIDINLQDEYLKKFPNCCPYCISSPCACIQTHKQPISKMNAFNAKKELINKFQAINNSPNPQAKNLDTLVENINIIYPSNRTIWSVHGAFYHFTRLFEELGEMHEAYSAIQSHGSQLKNNLGEEIADITAWLLSIWAISEPELKLSDEIVDYYIDGCPVCRESICRCSDYSDRQDIVVLKEQALNEIKAELKKLELVLKGRDAEIYTLIESVDMALKNDATTTDTKRVAKDMKSKLSDFRNITESAGASLDNLSNGANAIKRILKVISDLPEIFS